MQFNNPNTHNGIAAKDLLGELVLVYPIKYIPTDARDGNPGTYGVRVKDSYSKTGTSLRDAVVAQVHVLGEDGENAVYHETMFLQGRLIRDSKRVLRKWENSPQERWSPILARVEMDGNAFNFGAFTEADAERATEYLKENPVNVADLGVEFIGSNQKRESVEDEAPQKQDDAPPF